VHTQLNWFPQGAGSNLGALTPTQLAIRSAVLSSTFSANLNFTSPGFVNVTFAFYEAGYANRIGVFLFFPNGTIIRGSMVRAVQSILLSLCVVCMCAHMYVYVCGAAPGPYTP
jgi:hypothetical protein